MLAYNPSKRGFGKMNLENIENDILSQDEFLDYRNKYLQGDKQAINQIIASHLELVKNIVSSYENVDYNEYFSLGLSALWQAADEYNINEKIPFEEYAHQKIIKVCNTKYLKEARKSEQSRKSEQFYCNPIDQFIDDEVKKIVMQIIRTKLSHKHQVILRLYYNGLTMEEIGQKYGITKAEISRCHKEALQYLEYELYSAHIIDYVKDEKKYLSYRHNHPHTIYDLFIDYKKPRRLDNQVIDTILYFASPITKKHLEEGLGKNYCHELMVSDKDAYQKCTNIKSNMTRMLQSLTEEDIYDMDPVKLTILYLNDYCRDIDQYFGNQQTGELLNRQFVKYLILNIQPLRMFLINNGYNPYTDEVHFTNIYQWLRLKEFIPTFLREFKRLTYNDIFKLDYEQLVNCYQKCVHRTTGLVRELTNI